MQPLDYASISAEGMEDLRNVILAQLGPGARAVWRTANNMKRYGNLAELFGAGLSGASDVQLLSGENGSPLSRQPGLGALNGITSMFTGGSSQLSVGGVFGQDLQGKLIRLNETTNDLLQHIVDNTNIMAEAAEDMVGLSNMDTGTGS